MKRPSRDLDLALGLVIEAREMVAPGWSMAGASRAGGWRLAGRKFVSIIGSFLFALENKRPAVLR